MLVLSGAQAMVAGLERMGCERLYGIIGTSVLGFYEGLYERRDRIRYLSCRHEQVAASMADAEGRLTGRPGVAIVHSGPGALNAMISVGNATKDCSPMVLITGAVKSRLTGTDGMLEVDHLRLFSPIVKGGWRVSSVPQIPEILVAAYRTALDGAWGPVVIEVPENIWKERGEIDLESFRFERPSPPRPDEKDLKAIVEALARASRPLVLAGCGVAYARAAERLREWVEVIQVPVATTGNGRGVLPEDHPLSLGRCGFGGGNPAADYAFQKADLIVGLGCGISDMVTYEFTLQTDAEIHCINLDPAAGKKKVFIEKNLQADVGEALVLLQRFVTGRKIGPFTDWLEELVRRRDKWQRILSAAGSDGKAGEGEKDRNLRGDLQGTGGVRTFRTNCVRLSDPASAPAVPAAPVRSSSPSPAFPSDPPAGRTLSPSVVLARLDRLLPRDAIVCGGAGLHVVYAHNYLLARGPQQFLAAVNFGAMGFGMAAAMAAKLCHPKRAVLAVLGDGEFLMTVQDLETVVREKIGVKILVVNDNSYRVLELKQRLQYQGHVIGTRHGNPDLMELARAFGLPGIRLRSPEEVAKGLHEMLDGEGPVLVEVVTDPEDIPATNLEAALKMGQV